MAGSQVIFCCLFLFHVTTILANEMCPGNFTLSESCECYIYQEKSIVTCNYTAQLPTDKLLNNKTDTQDINFDKLFITGYGLATLPDNYFEGTTFSSIDASRHSFTDLPLPIQLMQSLTNLDLSHNGIETFNISWLSSLTSLKYLNLAHNNIQTLTNDGAGASISNTLDILDLSHNSLLLIEPHSKLWTSVKHLSLSHNQLTSAITRVESDILRTLDLTGNKITIISNGNFINLPRLVALNMSKNQIDTIEDGGFEGLDELRHLDLSDNSLSDVRAGMFEGLKILSILNVSYNNLQQLSSGVFDGLKILLKELFLNGNDLKMIPADTFQNLMDLKSLNLSRNPNLKEIREIVFPSHLLYLDISHCSLIDIDDCQFKNMVDLQLLDLRGNNLTCSCHLTWLYNWQQQNQASMPYQSVTSPLWYCQDSGQNVVPVDTNTSPCPGHITTLNHCEDVTSPRPKGTMNPWDIHDIWLNMTLEVTDNAVLVTWGSDNSWDIYGFRVVIPTSNAPDFLFESAILHKDARTYTLSFSERSEYDVCIQVLRNETSMIHEECESVSSNSLTIIVGALAGTIFLVPCMAALTYIVYRDRSKHAEDDYAQLHLDDVEKQSDYTTLHLHHVEKQSDSVSEKGSGTKQKGHNHHHSRQSPVSKEKVHTHDHSKESPVSKGKGQVKKVTIREEGQTKENPQTIPEKGQANKSYVADPTDIDTHVCHDHDCHTKSDHSHDDDEVMKTGKEADDKHICDSDHKTICVKF